MLKRDVTYVDFNGMERTDTLYFNLNEPEIVRLEVQFDGGLEEFIRNFDPQDRPDEVLYLYETVLLNAYGEKSSDGRFFEKSEELKNRFRNSAAYAALFMELLLDQDAAEEFMSAVITPSRAGVLPQPGEPNQN